MQTIALVLSIISSLLFIVYLIAAMLAPKQDNTITIRGSFTTRTIDVVRNSYTTNRVIDHN